MTDLLRATLQRAAVDDLEFPCTLIEQHGARAVAENEQWRRDGAELVDGGRRAYRGRMTAVLLSSIDGYGELFPRRYEDLVRVFETRAEVTLRHPLLGTFRVKVPTWTPRIEGRVRNGGHIDFEWIEQRAGVVGVVALDPERGDGDPEAETLAAADATDTALAAAGAPMTPTVVSTVKPAVAKAVAKDATYPELVRSLADIDDAAADADLALAARAFTASTAVAIHAARRAVTDLRAAAARLGAALLPDPSRTRTFVAPRRMTLAEVSLAVYGSPARAADLRIANGIATTTVRAGRALRVLP